MIKFYAIIRNNAVKPLMTWKNSHDLCYIEKTSDYRTILNRSYFLTIYTKKKHLVAQIIIIKKIQRQILRFRRKKKSSQATKELLPLRNPQTEREPDPVSSRLILHSSAAIKGASHHRLDMFLH